jgi:hypothetical protein
MKLVAILSLFALHISAYANCEARGPNVILLSLDGVRNQEFFKGTDSFHRRKIARTQRGVVFQKFWKEHAQDGVVLGHKNGHKIASQVAISLPSYQAIMTGHATECRNNHCGQVKEETIFDRLQAELKLPEKDLAVFASWQGMKFSVAKDPQNHQLFIYPDMVKKDSLPKDILDLQEKAMSDLPLWKESRKDHYTFEMGMGYLEKFCPRVLYISLVDSDEFGHADDYPGYINSLKIYDDYIDRLITSLKKMGAYGKQTTLIVTTDHSRGDALRWTSHGYDDNSNKEVFLFATGRGVKKVGREKQQTSHAQIKPTIEYLMGLKPQGEVLPFIDIK